MGEAELARFIDRFTVEYVRTYPHPIERVWRAITDPAEFRRWFLPGRIALETGGAYWFQTGDDGFGGVIDAIEPPTFIRFRDAPDAEGYFQYELSAAEGGTRMRFVQHFADNHSYAPTEGDPGGDLPGGPDTPWKPGFVGGWHEFWDALGDYLDGAPAGSRLPPTEMQGIVKHWTRIAILNGMEPEVAARCTVGLRRAERWAELNKVYRRHIRETLPRREGAGSEEQGGVIDLGRFEVALDVADIARSLAFYQAAGFEVVDGGVAARHATVQKGDCRIGLYQGFLDPPTTQLIFVQGDVEAIHRRLSGQGLAFDKPPARGDGDGIGAMLKDPDGHPLYFVNLPES